MYKILQINSVVNTGSTGRIAEEIGNEIINITWESYIAYGRKGNASNSKLIKIGSKLDIFFHLLKTRLFDRHGFGSISATNKFIKRIIEIKPDIIHLHNIHGYFINIEILFHFLAKNNIPVVWTLHDCWAFTGHCAHYTDIKCDKWITNCNKCPQIQAYPASYFDNSKRNFNDKSILFNSLENLTLIPVSKWLEGDLKKSFLKNNKIKQIYNGIDLTIFRPQNTDIFKKRYKLHNLFIILGVASTWTKKKGLFDFFSLSKMLAKDEIIILIGLNENQIKDLPQNIIGIAQTENVQDLSLFYNSADVYLNPTWEDTFPTTNIEALACGTPVITYNTGGSVEAIDSFTGIVVKPGDILGLANAIKHIKDLGKNHFEVSCQNRAEMLFNKKERFLEYISLYKKILNI